MTATFLSSTTLEQCQQNTHDNLSTPHNDNVSIQ
jgi:hypothetical protein